MNSMEEYNILSIQVKEESSLTPNYHMKALTGVMIRIYTSIKKVHIAGQSCFMGVAV